MSFINEKWKIPKKMNTQPSELDEVYEIDEKYVASSMIGSLTATLLIALGGFGLCWLIIGITVSEGDPLNRSLMWTIYSWTIIGIFVVVNGLSYILSRIYVNNFSYEFSEKFIIIRYGIFTRTKTTIPYSRIQNVAVHQNIRDRILDIYTVKVETAGSSAATANAQKGLARPEGYIPAVKDPSHLENMINKLVHQYTQDVSEPIRKQVFTDNNVAFDEFIAYFLSKMREKDQLNTNIKSLREQAGLSQAAFADKLNVSKSTIEYLEAGEYVPSLTLALNIAKEFHVPIEQIFKLK